MAKFSAYNTKELESNADLFIKSIALAEESSYKKDIKEKIIQKIKEIIIHSEIALVELGNS